ncbi:MAG: CopG family transcriptional regulator [Myxococcota bacterium]|jgi:hypothetical protein|nr:CopG family transcriptional regulator [Myxococcota bacterium]
MRTTLTIEDDLARRLKEKARREGRPFKTVVNEVLCAGLGGPGRPVERPAFEVVPVHAGFRPGIDPARLNQLLDELETDDFFDEASS